MRDADYETQNTNMHGKKSVARLLRNNKTRPPSSQHRSSFKISNNITELYTSIRMLTLDDKVSWTLNKCWLSDKDQNILRSTTTTVSSVTKLATTKKITFEAASMNIPSEDYYDEEYANSVEYSVENSKENFRLVRETPIMTKLTTEKSVERDSDATIKIEDSINFKINYVKNVFKISRENNAYELNVSMAVKFFNLPSPKISDKMFIMCNLKPIQTCDKSVLSANKHECNYARKTAVLDYFNGLSDTSQKMKTVVLAKLDSESVYPALIKNFVYKSSKMISFYPEPSVTTIIDTKILNSTKKELATKKISTNKLPDDKTASGESEWSLTAWLDENKITLVLALIFFSTTLIIIVMLKVVNSERSCKSFFYYDISIFFKSFRKFF